MARSSSATCPPNLYLVISSGVIEAPAIHASINLRANGCEAALRRASPSSSYTPAASRNPPILPQALSVCRSCLILVAPDSAIRRITPSTSADPCGPRIPKSRPCLTKEKSKPAFTRYCERLEEPYTVYDSPPITTSVPQTKPRGCSGLFCKYPLTGKTTTPYTPEFLARHKVPNPPNASV